MHRTTSRTIVAAAFAVGLGGTAPAQEIYTIGITAALTGPPASTYAPAVDGLRIYAGNDDMLHLA